MTTQPPDHEATPQTPLVRPYVLDEDHRARNRDDRDQVQQARADRDRLGLAVLVDIAEAADQTRELAGVH